MAKQWIASDLREIIVLEEGAEATVLGVTTTAWTTVSGAGELRANIRYESESERVRAGRNEGRESIVVVTRKGPAVTPKNRIQWRGDPYVVTGFPQYLDIRRLFFKFSAVRTDAD